MSVIAFTDLITYKPMKMAISSLSTVFCNVKMKFRPFSISGRFQQLELVGTIETDLYPFCPRKIFEEMKLPKS